MKTFLNIIRVILNCIMTLIIVVGCTFIILYVAGIEPFVVESGSMEPTIQTGSLSFINKHAEYSDMKENDIIAFKAATGAKVTHRVKKVTNRGLETKGDRNSNSDGITTTEKNFIGKNIFSIPKLGYVVKTMQTTTGKIILITVIIVILLSGIFMNDGKKKEKKIKKE
ncbi:MAG: signal peptidase I [Clostridia bacterium]|nr:signal peptidase I [Clostridia bacterium]